MHNVSADKQVSPAGFMGGDKTGRQHQVNMILIIFVPIERESNGLYMAFNASPQKYFF